MNRRDPIWLAWAAGLALAALVYVVGPDRFVFRLMDTLHVLAWRISEAIEDLSMLTLDVVRALAIGVYATFVALAISVARRGGKVDTGTAPNARWTAALLVAAAGAAVMTSRMRQGTAVTHRPVLPP